MNDTGIDAHIKHDCDCQKERYEKCVLCGCTMKTPVEQEIEYRAFYIEGAGQLCYDCYKKLYS